MQAATETIVAIATAQAAAAWESSASPDLSPDRSQWP